VPGQRLLVVRLAGVGAAQRAGLGMRLRAGVGMRLPAGLGTTLPGQPQRVGRVVGKLDGSHGAAPSAG